MLHIFLSPVLPFWTWLFKSPLYPSSLRARNTVKFCFFLQDFVVYRDVKVINHKYLWWSVQSQKVFALKMHGLFWKGTYSSNQHSITDTQIWCSLLNWPGSCFHGKHQVRSPSLSLGQLLGLFSFLLLNTILVEVWTKVGQNCHRNSRNHLWQSTPCATSE